MKAIGLYVFEMCNLYIMILHFQNIIYSDTDITLVNCDYNKVMQLKLCMTRYNVYIYITGIYTKD